MIRLETELYGDYLAGIPDGGEDISTATSSTEENKENKDVVEKEEEHILSEIESLVVTDIIKEEVAKEKEKDEDEDKSIKKESKEEEKPTPCLDPDLYADYLHQTVTSIPVPDDPSPMYGPQDLDIDALIEEASEDYEKNKERIKKEEADTEASNRKAFGMGEEKDMKRNQEDVIQAKEMSGDVVSEKSTSLQEPEVEQHMHSIERGDAKKIRKQLQRQRGLLRSKPIQTGSDEDEEDDMPMLLKKKQDLQRLLVKVRRNKLIQ